MCKERSLERDIYVNEGAPIIDQISEDELNNLLSELYDDSEGDTLIKMHDNEDLHDIARLIHSKWKFNKCTHLNNQLNTTMMEMYSFEFENEILKMWDKALRRALTKEANKELEYRHESKQENYKEEN